MLSSVRFTQFLVNDDICVTTLRVPLFLPYHLFHDSRLCIYIYQTNQMLYYPLTHLDELTLDLHRACSNKQLILFDIWFESSLRAVLAAPRFLHFKQRINFIRGYRPHFYTDYWLKDDELLTLMGSVHSQGNVFPNSHFSRSPCNSHPHLCKFWLSPTQTAYIYIPNYNDNFALFTVHQWIVSPSGSLHQISASSSEVPPKNIYRFMIFNSSDSNSLISINPVYENSKPHIVIKSSDYLYAVLHA